MWDSSRIDTHSPDIEVPQHISYAVGLEKNNLPKNHNIPKELKTFLGAVKSEIMDHRNRNHIPCNIPQEELAALKELIRLQRDRVITIKSCDKGAGLIILDFNEYINACESHLESQTENGEYYIKVMRRFYKQHKIRFLIL